MTNIIIPLSLLVVGITAFKVPAVHDNPDLIIDEELNFVEPKTDMWNILLRPKAKTTFKSILKLLSSLDMRDKYSVTDEQVPDSPQPLSTDFIVVKKEDFERGEQIVLTQEEGIVSDEAPDKESLSEEHQGRVAVGSLSVESDENSGASDESAKDDSQNSESKESASEESTQNTDGPEASKEPQPEKMKFIHYPPKLPMSLHNVQQFKPRYQHSIRDGWTY